MNNCYLHEQRPATRSLAVPCAPGGSVWVCDECHSAEPDSVLRHQLFEKYLRRNQRAIREQRAADAARGVGDN